MRVLPLLLLLTACGGHPSPASGRLAHSPFARLEHTVFVLVNEYRAARSLPPLRYRTELAAVAREHSQAMAAGHAPFSHEGLPERTQVLSRMLPVLDVAENLVWLDPGSPGNALPALRAWIESAAHREALEGCFTFTGVGIARDPTGRYYYTQLFVLRPPSPPVRSAAAGKVSPRAPCADRTRAHPPSAEGR